MLFDIVCLSVLYIHSTRVDLIILSEEEKEYVRVRRQSNQSLAQRKKAQADAAAAIAKARWTAAGGDLQSHPEMPNKELKEAVEGPYMRRRGGRRREKGGGDEGFDFT